MKCKRRKAFLGTAAAIASIVSALASTGKGIYDSVQNKKRLEEQQRATNLSNIDEQNSLLQQNLGQLANNRDYITDRQNDVILNTRNTNQLAMGGYRDRFKACFGMRKRR